MEINLKVNMIFSMCFICTFVGHYRCASINDTNILLRDMLEGYNKNVRPIENQSDVLNVNVSLFIISIQELDEIRGIFSIMGILDIRWHDANMMWDPKIYGGVENVLTSYKEVWVPELILINPAEQSDTFGKKWQRVIFDHNGFATWWPVNLIKSTCTLDVSNYPFDSQECVLKFAAWGYVDGQLKLNPLSSQLNLEFYSESSTWTLAKSKVNALYDWGHIHFHVFLERKAGFITVNIILPLTFLSLLNAFVFLLLPESGERISYCITVLLAIAVFMTIVSDTLPKSSEPVPVISYKLIFDMIISSLITLVTILNLRLYNRTDKENVPHWLQIMYLYLSCKRIKAQINPLKHNDKRSKYERKEDKTGNGNGCLNSDQPEEKDVKYNTDIHIRRQLSVAVTALEEVPCENCARQLIKVTSNVRENGETKFCVDWKNISNMVDGIAFVVFIIFSICSFVVFIIKTS